MLDWLEIEDREKMYILYSATLLYSRHSINIPLRNKFSPSERVFKIRMH